MSVKHLVKLYSFGGRNHRKPFSVGLRPNPLRSLQRSSDLWQG